MDIVLSLIIWRRASLWY